MEPRHRRDDGRAARGGQDGRGRQGLPPGGAAVPARRRGHQVRARARLRAADPKRRQRLLHRRRPRAPRPRRLLLRHRHQPGPRRRRRPPQDPPLPRVRRLRPRPRMRPPLLPAQHVQGQGDGADTAPRRRSGGRGEEAEEGRGVPGRRPGRLLPVPEAARGGLRDAAGRVPRVRPHRGLAAGRRRARVGRLRGPRQGAARHRRRRDSPRRDGTRRCRHERRRGRRAGLPRAAAAAAGASGGAPPPGGPRAQLIGLVAAWCHISK